MKRIGLDSVLLFTLVIPFIMTYRLSWGDTPYLLFGLIFLGIFVYIVTDFISVSQKKALLFKQILLWCLIIVVIGSAFISAIVVRHQTAPTYSVHDIILQQEAAIQFLLAGKNPYATTYFGTQLENWHYSATEINPALYHFVMEPFYLLFALPFYFTSITLFGFFDGRMPLLFLFFTLLVLAARLVKNQEKRLLFLTLLAFNPAMLGYTLEGRSDIFMFTFLFASLFFLYNRRYIFSSILLALAFAVKQSAWPILPFYVAYLYFKTKSIPKVCMAILPFLIALIPIVLPFFLWDAKAFIDSTILYLSGGATHSYPISGYGLGRILNNLGIVSDLHQYFPFHILQAVIGIPLFIALVRFLKQAPTVHKLIVIYGIFLFVFWYLSRYFNNSHLGYLSMIFIAAYFWPNEEQVK